ncbi:MAG: carboxypeptidase-like regulatory domain-containing protein [Candidatus Thermoplasmatota archaeon]
MQRLLAAAFALTLAGCAQAGELPPPEAADATRLVEGWIRDVALIPIVGASATAPDVNGTQTDAEGHFTLRIPRDGSLFVRVAADGFEPATKAIPSGEAVLNFTLERIPDGKPYQVVTTFRGFLSCGLAVAVGGNPGQPHEHKAVRCSDALGNERNLWVLDAPSPSGIVLETFWDATTELSQALLVKLIVVETGEILGFREGPGPLRIQPSQAALAAALAAGHTIAALAETGAGTGNHDHGAVGATVEQEFQFYLTSFFNGLVDPSYTIADA